MQTIITNLLYEIEEELELVLQSHDDRITYARKAFEAYYSKTEKLKLKLQKHEFKENKEEISFFKEQKPAIESKVIYYSKIFQIESQCAGFPVENQLDIFKEEKEKIMKYFQSKREYFNYHKTKNNLSDQYYFIRNNEIHKYEKFKNIDFTYSTGYDHYFITIIAYEQLLEYFTLRIEELRNPIVSLKNTFQSDLVWTADQVDMVELIYALKENKSINDGQISIKRLIEVFEQVFDYKIKDKYRIFNDIKNRNNPIIFLESCIEALERKIDRGL